MFSRPSHRGAALAALALITLVLYLPGIHGPALLDDRHNLAPLADLERGTLSLSGYLFAPGAGGVPRPIPKASFVLNWWMSGDRLAAYKLTNVVLHLACGGLVYLLCSVVLRRGAPATSARPAPGESGPHALALFITALWLLSPLLVSTVLYVVQRMAQLAALFSLSCLLCYLHARCAVTPGARRLGLLAAAVLGVAGLASKQNAAVLPLLLLLAEYFVLRGERRSARARRALWLICSAAAAALAARVALDPGWLLEAYGARDFDLTQRLLTQPRVLLDYAANLLLWPFARPMGLFHDDLLPSRGLLQPWSTLAALLALGALLALALRARTGALAPAGFGALFFVAAHAVESGPFALELYFEHRNYLPAVGLLLALGVLAGAAHRRSASRWLWPAVMGAAVLASAVLAANRVSLWRSEASLYAAAVAQHPGSPRAHLGLAAVYFNAGDEGSARASLEAAAALLPTGARFGLALNALAPYCAGRRPAPAWVLRRLAEAAFIGDDFYTLNAMAWFDGALADGACTAADTAALRQALDRLAGQAAPAGTRQREQARAERIARLRRSLARAAGG